MKFGLKNQDLDRICKIFNQFPEIDAVILYGSRSLGSFKTGSDVDLALIGDIDHSTLSRVRFLLNEEIPLPYFFDVVLYAEIKSQELKNHIDHHGTTLYQKKNHF